MSNLAATNRALLLRSCYVIENTHARARAHTHSLYFVSLLRSVEKKEKEKKMDRHEKYRRSSVLRVFFFFFFSFVEIRSFAKFVARKLILVRPRSSILSHSR